MQKKLFLVPQLSTYIGYVIEVLGFNFFLAIYIYVIKKKDIFHISRKRGEYAINNASN